MRDTDDSADKATGKPRRGMGKMGWIATLILVLALGGGGFYATFSGMVGGGQDMARPIPEQGDAGGYDTATSDAPSYLELDPLMVSVGGAGSVRQLRFRAYLQLDDRRTDVASLQPRILDIFATYLRAISIARLEDPTALLHLRAQLLRRVQLLTGPNAVSDLLIIDFVIT